MDSKFKEFFVFVFKYYKYETIKIFFLSLLETILEVFSIVILIDWVVFYLQLNCAVHTFWAQKKVGHQI